MQHDGPKPERRTTRRLRTIVQAIVASARLKRSMDSAGGSSVVGLQQRAVSPRRNSVINAVDVEQKCLIVHERITFINPFGVMWTVFSAATYVLTLYVCWVTPFVVFFENMTGQHYALTSFFAWRDYAVHTTFAIELLAMGAVAGNDRFSENVVLVRRAPRANAKQMWHLFLSAVPFVAFSHQKSTAVPVLRLCCLLRLYKLDSRLPAVLYDLRNEYFSVSSLCRFLFTLFFATHMLACLFDATATYYGNAEESWSSQYCRAGHVDDSDLPCYYTHYDSYQRYGVAFYYAFTCTTTVGYSSTTPVLRLEVVLHTMAVFFGGVFYSAFLVNLLEFFDHVNRADRLERQAVATTSQLLTLFCTPHKLRRTVIRSIGFHFHQSKGVRLESALDGMAPELRLTVIHAICQNALGAHSFLNTVDPAVTNELMLRAVLRFFQKDEAVFLGGQVPDGMYLVILGRLFVEPSTETHLHTLGPGDIFGEIGSLRRTTRLCTVRADTECRLLFVSNDHLEIVQNFYPREMRMFERLIDRRINGFESAAKLAEFSSVRSRASIVDIARFKLRKVRQGTKFKLGKSVSLVGRRLSRKLSQPIASSAKER
jgi:CRP-like cAMP-binding protein